MPRVTGLTCKEGGWKSPKGQEARRTPREVQLSLHGIQGLVDPDSQRSTKAAPEGLRGGQAWDYQGLPARQTAATEPEVI